MFNNVNKYFVVYYLSIIKFIGRSVLLIVSGVLNFINSLKSYITILYLKYNSKFLLILALPIVCDFNFLFTIYYYNYFIMCIFSLVYFVSLFLNLSVFSSLFSEYLIYIGYLLGNCEQITGLFSNLSFSNNLFGVSDELEIKFTELTETENYILLSEGLNPEQNEPVSSQTTSEQQDPTLGTEINDPKNLPSNIPNEIVSELNNIKVLDDLFVGLTHVVDSPNMDYEYKAGVLNSNKDLYNDYFTNTLNQAIANNDQSKITETNNNIEKFNSEITNLQLKLESTKK